MKRTFCCLLHASDCVEEVEVTIDEGPCFVDDPCLGGKWYTLVSYPSTCKCGGYVPHADPPQEELRRAYNANDAEEV